MIMEDFTSTESLDVRKIIREVSLICTTQPTSVLQICNAKRPIAGQMC